MAKNTFIFVLTAFLLFAGCAEKNGLTEFTGKTMGTTYYVKVASKNSFDNERVKKEISEILKKVNKQMSTYMKESEISKLNLLTADSPFELNEWFYDVLAFSLDVAEKTKGLYDPTLGPLVNLWGFGPEGERKVPTDEKIEELKKSVGYDKLKLYQKNDKWLVEKSNPGVYLDLSSSAKGYAVDKIADFLKLEGLNNFFVEVGGEIKASGKKFDKDWMVAIERPEANQRSVYKSFPLNNLSIATSGSYRNFFESGGKSYSHTIDASTGRPVDHVMVSATVIDKSCMKADAYATALMVLGPEKAKALAKVESLAVYIIYKSQDGEGESSFATYSSNAFKTLNTVLD